MRLQSTGSHDAGAGDEIFMNFASGGHTEERNDDAVDRGRSDYEDPLDDVFGSAPSSPALQTSHSTNGALDEDAAALGANVQDPSDIPRLRSVHVTNGYREGLSAAKEQYVQAGFDEGYALGAELGMKAGWILGVLEGVIRAVGGSTSTADEGLGREEVKAEVVRAEEELAMGTLFGEEFFGGDGVWVYPVPGTDGDGKGDEGVTFKEVAEAHPAVAKWETRASELVERLGLKMEG